MPVGQTQFDADLAAYIAADAAQEQLVSTYIAAVTAFIALPPIIDLSAEDTAVNAALTAVQTSQAAVTAAQAQLPPPPPVAPKAA